MRIDPLLLVPVVMPGHGGEHAPGVSARDRCGRLVGPPRGRLAERRLRVRVVGLQPDGLAQVVLRIGRVAFAKIGLGAAEIGEFPIVIAEILGVECSGEEPHGLVVGAVVERPQARFAVLRSAGVGGGRKRKRTDQ